ncbi:1-aminocyclopropane-1-carboxylate deaminase/D-cysteine desulfhydrase [Flavobacterium sp. NKUCC04_CG]|uniref:1-aminocyclopropane-1-carboxylate deaminase/D-cysteine desulfhydrase n=1 Tax=Flavobacterium sp. NKUCC04_CG TaxID=2842121 RepID=UPI001C5A6D17|nr:pyridoxal-phosphate dependent enzyme [Flavobacterium sp. NKUCC04_CG]MBW3517740.1 pyridoxal-phosphate dependent enzyme [Flavobacterium sp. NKUCC04_CG]
MFVEQQIENQKVELFFKHDISLYIKREDLLHPQISGNKFRKLKYNLLKAKDLGLNTLLTFGGAFSNHIAATAAAGKEFGFQTIGVIRGEELSKQYLDNPTLRKAEQNGMLLKFITRKAYREKTEPHFLADLKTEFSNFYLIPEGGTNDLAVKGCEEILKEQDLEFDYICSAVGTGGTVAGLINSVEDKQFVLGFPALKGSFLNAVIDGLVVRTNWNLIHDYHFGGYAKTTPELMQFLKVFHQKTGVLLDPIYTGKMMYGIIDLIEKDYFPKGSKILAIHTGGLQGWNSKFDLELVKI